jgi:hypothetical protein
MSATTVTTSTATDSDRGNAARHRKPGLPSVGIRAAARVAPSKPRAPRHLAPVGDDTQETQR